MKLGFGLSLTSLRGPSVAGVADVAPSITTPASASASDAGMAVSYTFTPPVVAGTPAPAVTCVLMLNATDVTPAMAGDTYVATKTAATQALVMTYTAANSVAPAATSAVSQTVPAAAAPLVNTGTPAVTGTAQEGQTLTAGPGTWTGSPTGFAYQWRRGGVAIGGATAGTYAVALADVGSMLSVTVTASKAGTADVAATSAATATITAAGGGTVDLTAAAGSLRFPEGNNAPNTTASSTVKHGYGATVHTSYKGALAQAKPGATINIAANTVPQAIFAIVGFPLPKHVASDASVHGVFGASSGANTYRMRAYPLSSTNANGGRYEWYHAGSSGPGVTVLTPVVTEDAALLVVTCDGAANWQFDWYSLLDGTRFAGSPANSLTVQVNGAAAQFAIGANGTATAYTDNGVTSTNQWPGSIEAIGMVRRAVSVAEWQAIARGADIITTLGAANLPYLRDFDGTAATYARPAGATADVSVAAVPWAGTTGVPAATLAPGPTLRRQSDAQWLMANLKSAGHVFALSRGQTARSVTFDGTAGGLTGNVQVRVFRADTGAIVRDWTSLGAISGGVWSGSVTLPKSSSWLFADFRAASAPSVIFYGRQEFGVGWKFILLGQSQMSIGFGGNGVIPALAAPMTASWVTNDIGNRVQMARIGMAFDNDGKRAFLNQFRQFDATTPVMLIDEAINGTGMDQIISSASVEGQVNTRNMAQLTRKLAAVGTDVTAVLHQWGTNNMALAGAGFQNLLTALYYGTGPSAGDRSLPAELAAGWVPVICPLTRHTGAAVYTGNAQSARRAMVDWANAQTPALVVSPPVSDFRIENAGGPHQDATTLMGIAPIMSRMAIGAARMLGLDTSQNPCFSTAALTGGGATITIQTVLPNGGALYSPTPTALRSFQVSTDAGTTWLSAPGNFSAAISGNTVVLTKTSGIWSAGVRVRFQSGGEARADGDGTTEDIIIAGMLYETWSKDVVMGRGLPVVGSLSGGKWVPDWDVVAA